MKKTILFIVLAMTVCSLPFISCKHEIPVDYCVTDPIQLSLTATDAVGTQLNGTIFASATGGSDFEYSLNGGPFGTSGSFMGLAGNTTYTVIVRNSRGCSDSASISVGALPDPCAGVSIQMTISTSDPIGTQANGSITVSATGGSGFTYSLNNGTMQSGGTFNGLVSGNYIVRAQTDAGCFKDSLVTLGSINPCNTTNITVSSAVIDVLPCGSPANNGRITVTAGGSSGYSYSINGVNYQASNIFSGLAAGSYTVAVRDINGCTANTSAQIGTQAQGPLFQQVRSLVTSRCSGSGCHMNGQSYGGYNFDNDCSIVTYWSQIRSSTNANAMPKYPQPVLTSAEKTIISNWVNAGHTYAN